MSDFLRQRYEAIGLVLTGQCLAWYEVPLRLVSYANGRGASRGAAFTKAKQVKSQAKVGFRAGEMFRGHPSFDAGRASFHAVRVVRIAPRTLDPHDNLGVSAKAVVDGVARGLGIDDRDPRVRYVIDQRRGEPGEHAVRLELYAAPALEDTRSHAAGELRARHTDECLLAALDPGAVCNCRPPAVPEPLVGVAPQRRALTPTPNVVRPR